MAPPVPDKVVDTRGFQCPLPVLMAKRALDALARGGVLQVITADEATASDIKAFVRRLGYRLLHTEQKEQATYFYIQKS
jgi:tRNA 2-thiouridine synthesizing protein A